MCEYCGCRGVPPIGELMEEHDVILEDAGQVRTALGTGDRAEVVARLQHLAAHLGPHVRREERGIFAALRDQGDWTDEVSQLEGEHRDLDSALAALDVLEPDFDRDVLALLLELETHVERENLGIFPVSVVTLGAEGWDTVNAAHRQIPTFLTADQPGPPPDHPPPEETDPWRRIPDRPGRQQLATARGSSSGRSSVTVFGVRSTTSGRP